MREEATSAMDFYMRSSSYLGRIFTRCHLESFGFSHRSLQLYMVKIHIGSFFHILVLKTLDPLTHIQLAPLCFLFFYEQQRYTYHHVSKQHNVSFRTL